MVKQLWAILALGGIAVLGFGSLVPWWIGVPTDIVVSLGLAILLTPRLNRSLNSQIEAEREFSSNASHQLKTPLAALRFRLDDLSLWPETPTEIRAELIECMAEVDRLTSTVEDLLSLARDGRPAPTAASVDLADAAASAVGRWRRLFRESERDLAFSAPTEAVLVTTAPRPMLQVIDVLLENALAHGSGATKVAVSLDGGRGRVPGLRRRIDRRRRGGSHFRPLVPLGHERRIGHRAGARSHDRRRDRRPPRRPKRRADLFRAQPSPRLNWACYQAVAQPWPSCG